MKFWSRGSGTTLTTRLPRNATVYALAPQRAGKPGRSRLNGRRLGKQADPAGSATWRPVTVNRHGDLDTIDVARVPCIRHGSFGNAPSQCVLVGEPGTDEPYDTTFFSLDTDANAEQIVERYSVRWNTDRR